MTTPIETYVVPGVPDTSAFTITYAKTNSRENPHLITLKADWGDGDGKQLARSLTQPELSSTDADGEMTGSCSWSLAARGQGHAQASQD